MPKTNKEKLDKLYAERAALAAGLGYPSTSAMLTAMLMVWRSGGSIFMNLDAKETRFARAGRAAQIEHFAPPQAPAPDVIEKATKNL